MIFEITRICVMNQNSPSNCFELPTFDEYYIGILLASQLSFVKF